MKRKFTIQRREEYFQMNDDRHNEWHFFTATEAFRTTASLLNDVLIKQIYLVENNNEGFDVELTITPKAK